MPTVAEQTTGQIDERFDNRFVKVVIDDTTARTIGAGDIAALIVSDNANAVTFTIPESTAAAGKVFPIGSSFRVFTKGAGTVTVAKTGSDTLSGTATVAQNASKTVTKVSGTGWVIA
jgi:hypothetical protein